jgi:hypothetical protein
LRPGQALEAAGYIRVSRKVQAEGHSPEIQREAIKRLAKQEGYNLTWRGQQWRDPIYPIAWMACTRANALATPQAVTPKTEDTPVPEETGTDPAPGVRRSERRARGRRR